ncbi:hypothetical protein [Sphingobacterium kyonggiense]
MQPLKITILGDYFDCQIYRGRLYLWTFDGDIKIYQWSDIVKSLVKKETENIAMTFSFLDGNYLYKSSLIELFKDSDFRKLLIKKFSSIKNKNLILDIKSLDKFLLGQQQSPGNLLPTDTEIYSNKLYFINDIGLFNASVHRSKSDKFMVSSRPSKLWDCNLLSIKANNYPQLALSGGNEGLFELNMSKSKPSNLKTVETSTPIYQISKSHSSFSNYSYLNIYNTSLVEESFLAMFKWNMTKDKNNKDLPRRDYDSSIKDKELFNDTSNKHFISWGIEDKIYKAYSGGFEIIKYNNYANENNELEKFSRLGEFPLQEWKGKIINGGTAHFGNIVECENALVVVKSTNEMFTIDGPITRWRVYPRSMNYENHLHVILDDRIEIYSFNHDYFLNQSNKNFGIEFKQDKHTRFSKRSFFEDTNESIFINVPKNHLIGDLPF